MKTRSQTFILLLVGLTAAGAVFGVDQLMRVGASGAAGARFDRLLDEQIAGLNERITDARAVLATLAAAGKVDCDAPSLAARGEAIGASVEIADIARVDASGKTECTNLPISFQVLDGQGVKPHMLGPSETIATGLFGATELPALILTRRFEPDGGALVAVVPYAHLMPQPIAAKGAHIRLSFGATPVLIQADGEPHPASTIEAANNAFENSAATPGRRVVERANTFYEPLSLAMTLPTSVAWFEPNRLIADIVTGALVCSCGYLLFVRRRQPRRLKALIDRAIRRNEFEPLYRPIIDVTSGRVTAVRMEIVWHQGKRDLSEDEFMADVLEAQQDLKLVRSTLLRSRQTLAPIFKLRPRLLLKIVVSFETLLRPQFVDIIRRSMVGSGIRQSQLVISLPPISEASDPRHAFDVVKALQSCGIWVELLGSSDAIAFSYKTEQATAGCVGLDHRLYAALGGDDADAAARASLWISQMIDRARRVETRVCAYDVPDEGVLQTLRRLGVQEAEAALIVPALASDRLVSLVARAGIEPSEPEEEPETLEVRGLDESGRGEALAKSA